MEDRQKEGKKIRREQTMYRQEEKEKRLQTGRELKRGKDRDRDGQRTNSLIKLHSL